ncbi:hypothetical protein ADK57_04015 [Streptomyces sp. MMG1533]|uniref:hypothetical protein n=1 Tax=Streptomyces sp. MMG1533 TaxID=1415546 RepID=UPI0006AE8CB3|nr:hypothetical protein [Streptomyces sp. MMG1533]KOU77051.1 hypothetical protein ADK57_04015 [Streptomyces sp. MMG1533]
MQRVVYLRDRDDGQRMKDVVYVHPPRYKGEDFQNPAGLPRPVVAGLPFPWVTPMGDGVPLFREIERAKAELCRRLWGCQVCGNDLDVTAWVALQEPKDGSPVVSSAAIHPECLRIAVRYCPVLGDPGAGYVFTEVYEDDIVAVPDDSPDRNARMPAARWHLRAVAGTSRPDRVRSFRSLSEVRE